MRDYQPWTLGWVSLPGLLQPGATDGVAYTTETHFLTLLLRSEPRLPCLQMAVFSPRPHVRSSLGARACSNLFYKDTRHGGLEPVLKKNQTILLNYLLEAPRFKPSHVMKDQGSEIQHMNLQRTQFGSPRWSIPLSRS